MKPKDLDLRELLEFHPRGGVIRFAGRRALIMDAAALGLLRIQLIKTLGLQGARALLTQFGYAHGMRSAESVRKDLPWETERDWRIAGGRLHTLRGLVEAEPVVRGPGSGPEPFAEILWKHSYEAEQHLLHLGQASEPVCWSLVGFASGYLSYANGRPIYCMEARCVGKGDPVCHMVGRPKEEWGNAIDDQLAFYEGDCLRSSLQKITRNLKETESRLRVRRRQLERMDGVREDPSGIVCRSDVMRALLETARRASRVDTTVLITGPSGAGKERLARLVHDESARASGPLVAVNCAAVSEGLLESELFGHARGAFTGARQDRPGLFEAANGGTLFLDEVGEVPLSMQAKLLRALQQREVRRVGENANRKVDVRVVAATNRRLDRRVREGHFREDLYYRLKVIELSVPPLRERREDILALARRLLADLAGKMGRPVQGFTPRAGQLLLRYDWPGNVRELENAIERAIALADGDRIDADDLPEEIRESPAAAVGPGRTLEDLERRHILAAIETNGGNRERAASALGIGRATLYRKLRRYRASADRTR